MSIDFLLYYQQCGTISIVASLFAIISLMQIKPVKDSLKYPNYKKLTYRKSAVWWRVHRNNITLNISRIQMLKCLCSKWCPKFHENLFINKKVHARIKPMEWHEKIQSIIKKFKWNHSFLIFATTNNSIYIIKLCYSSCSVYSVKSISRE